MPASTTGADAVVVLFNALGPEEQEDAYARIDEVRIRQLAGTENSMARFIRSMALVAEYVGHVPSVDEYKQASEELRAAGEDIENFSRLNKLSHRKPCSGTPDAKSAGGPNYQGPPEGKFSCPIIGR